MAPTSRQTAEHLDRLLELGSLRLRTCGARRAPGANRHSRTCARCSAGQRAHVAPACSSSATRRRRQGSVRVRLSVRVEPGGSVDASLSVGQSGVWSLLSGLCWSAVRVGSDRYTGAHTVPRGASRFERTLRRFGSRKRCAKRRRVRPRVAIGTNPGSQGIFMTHTTCSNF